MMKSLFFTLLITLLLLACNKESNSNPNLFCGASNPELINIRIFNTSSYDIKNLNYENIERIDSISSGDTTSYIQLEETWDVPWLIEMTINGKMIRNRIIDRLGQSMLESGCYTYLLHAHEYGQGEIYAGGRMYANENLIDFEPLNQECIELEKTECNPQSTKANIRLRNFTAFDFCNVVVDMNGREQVQYGNLASGETTCYLSFESAKEYPLACQFILGEKKYTIENPSYYERLDDLSADFYTYNIYIIDPVIMFGDIVMIQD